MSNSNFETGNSFFWYDYETFGRDTRRDRLAQFGGFRTDENLVPRGKELLLYCSPADDYLPDPGSSLVTGITPLTCLTEGVPESVFANTIYQEFKKPGTTVVGYNNISFDDEFTRFMFWRNLINPYDREYGEGRKRMDMLTVVRALYAFKPNAINWPLREDGKHSFKLENLSKANGLLHEHAHDALSDAKATCLLAKTIRAREPKFWDYCVWLTDKEKVYDLLEQKVPLLYLLPYYNHATKSLKPVFPLWRNGSTALVWDLNVDPAELPQITLDDIRQRRFLTKEQKAQGMKPLPIIEIKCNKYPFLVKASPYFRGDFETMIGMSRQTLLERSEVLKQADNGIIANIASNIEEASQQRLPSSESGETSEIETGLYEGGFLSDSDRNKLEQLRVLDEVELSEKASTVDFKYPGLSDLLVRYIARNTPEAMTQEQSEAWYMYKAQHLVGGVNQARTFDVYFELIEQLLQEHAEHEEVEAILTELQEYGEQLREDYE